MFLVEPLHFLEPTSLQIHFKLNRSAYKWEQTYKSSPNFFNDSTLFQFPPRLFFFSLRFPSFSAIIRYFEPERSWLTLRCLAQTTCEHQHLWGLGLEDTWTTEERLESGKPQSVCSPPSEEGRGMSDGSWKFACPSHQGFVGTIQGLQVHALMVLTFSTQELEFFFGGESFANRKRSGCFWEIPCCIGMGWKE